MYIHIFVCMLDIYGEKIQKMFVRKLIFACLVFITRDTCIIARGSVMANYKETNYEMEWRAEAGVQVETKCASRSLVGEW